MERIKLLELIGGESPLFWINENQIDSLSTSNETKRVVSIVGKENMGKSTLMNQIIGHAVFEVSNDKSEGIEKTTRGIDLSQSDQSIFLDTEGVGNICQANLENYEHMLLTIAMASSDIIIALVSFKDRNDSGGFFINFLRILFANSIDLVESKKTLLVVINDKKQNDEVREKFILTIEKEWENALKKYLHAKHDIGLDTQHEHNDLLLLYNYFAIEVMFLYFDHENDAYKNELVQPIKEFIHTSETVHPVSHVGRTTEMLTGYFNVNPLDKSNPVLVLPKFYSEEFYRDLEEYGRDFIAKCKTLPQSFTELSNFQEKLSEYEEEFKRALISQGIPNPLILKLIYVDCFEELKFITSECIDNLMMYSISDIHLYYFKLACASLKYTVFDKYAYSGKIRNLENDLHIKLEDLELPDFLLTRILEKKEIFQNKLKSELAKSVSIDIAINIGTLCLGGLLGGVVASARALSIGVRVIACAGILGTSVTGIIIKDVVRFKTNRIGALDRELEALVEYMKTAKGTKLVMEIDKTVIKELEESHTTIQSFELEKKITNENL